MDPRLRCSACNSLLSADVRWCPVCFRNVSFPQIGKLATPSRRLGAYLIDNAIAVGLQLPLGIALEIGSRAIIAASLLIFAIFFLAYLILLARATTPGKVLLGLYVYRYDGKKAGFFRMFLREGIGKSISGAVFLLGLLWVLRDKERQGWHDKILKTHVVEVERSIERS